MKRPHNWVPSTLGHGENQCTYCKATNREIAVIGDMHHCPKAPAPETTSDGCFLICPYCDYKHTEPYEFELTEDGHQIECDECERFFHASAVRSVDYIGAPLTGEEDECT